MEIEKYIDRAMVVGGGPRAEQVLLIWRIFGVLVCIKSLLILNTPDIPK